VVRITRLLPEDRSLHNRVVVTPTIVLDAPVPAPPGPRLPERHNLSKWLISMWLSLAEGPQQRPSVTPNWEGCRSL
jgi:hypothetical protein